MRNDTHLQRQITITNSDFYKEVKEIVKGHKEINVYYEMKFSDRFYLFANCKYTLTPLSYKDFDGDLIKGGLLVLNCEEIKTIDSKIFHRKLKIEQINKMNETGLEV
jgi:hypothetical protein